MQAKSLTLVPLAAAAAVALLLSGPVRAQTFTFSSTLTGAAESPPVATTAGGSVLVTFDSVASTVSVSEWFFGLSAGLSDNHIHCCTVTPLTGTAGVAVGFTGLPVGATTGSYAHVFTLAPASFTSLLNGALSGKAYVNIHTTAFTSGEIRGFLQLVAATVPEPGTYALMLCGLAAVGLLARRRRG